MKIIKHINYLHAGCSIKKPAKSPQFKQFYNLYVQPSKPPNFLTHRLVSIEKVRWQVGKSERWKPADVFLWQSRRKRISGGKWTKREAWSGEKGVGVLGINKKKSILSALSWFDGHIEVLTLHRTALRDSCRQWIWQPMTQSVKTCLFFML